MLFLKSLVYLHMHLHFNRKASDFVLLIDNKRMINEHEFGYSF